jgi:hypothetical protein
LAGLKTGAQHGRRVVPGMKIKSSGDAARPRRQIPLRVSHFATKGEVRRESSGGREVIAVDLRRRNFTSSGSITDIAALSLLERIDNGAPSIRHESTRSERKTRRSGRHPRSGRQLGLIQNHVMKQRLTEKLDHGCVLFVQHISKNGCRDIVWTPVKNLAFTADVNGTHLDQKYSGTILSPGIPAVAKPAARYELKDQDAINVLLRAQRNF